MNSKNEVFESAPIPRAVATMAIPTMVTTLVMVAYNMADTFFIGQTGDPVQVAAVSLAFPVFTVLMSIGSLFGMGGNSCISRALGAGKLDRVKHISAFCFYGAFLTGLVISLTIFLFMEPVLTIIGVSETTHDFSQSYLTFITLGACFVVTAGTCGNMLRGEGAATASMVGNLIGTFANIILDPIFILGFGWGVGGAAIATVLGNMLACCYYLLYFFRANTVLSINPREIRIGDKIASGVISIGIPNMLNQLLMSVSTVIMNTTISKYGDIPLAAMNVALKSNMIVVFMQMGLCMGILPLIGYNYGSGNKKRLVSIYKFTAACTITMGTILTAFMVFARRYVVAAFINDPEVISYGMRMVIALEFSGPVIGMAFLSNNTLQGMGKAAISMFLTVCRQGFIYIPAVLILDRVLGLSGLIYAQPISDYISIILSFSICMVTIHRLKPSGRFAEGYVDDTGTAQAAGAAQNNAPGLNAGNKANL